MKTLYVVWGGADHPVAHFSASLLDAKDVAREASQSGAGAIMIEQYDLPPGVRGCLTAAAIGAFVGNIAASMPDRPISIQASMGKEDVEIVPVRTWRCCKGRVVEETG